MKDDKNKHKNKMQKVHSRTHAQGLTQKTKVIMKTDSDKRKNNNKHTYNVSRRAFTYSNSAQTHTHAHAGNTLKKHGQ